MLKGDYINMEKMFRVPLKFGGYKYFVGEDAETKANAYEVELKQREIEEKERQKRDQEERAAKYAKAEAERKAKEEKKSALVTQIKQKSNELHNLLKQYEEQEGRSFVYYDKDFNDINLTRLINGLVNGIWSF